MEKSPHDHDLRATLQHKERQKKSLNLRHIEALEKSADFMELIYGSIKRIEQSVCAGAPANAETSHEMPREDPNPESTLAEPPAQHQESETPRPSLRREPAPVPVTGRETTRDTELVDRAALRSWIQEN